MKLIKPLFIAFLMMSIVFISCDEDDPQIKITSISFNSATVEVVQGTTVDLDDILTIEGEDADQADISFESDDESVVSVDGNTLSAVAIGEATVEATESNTGETATISVTVIENVVAVTGVTLNEESADLKVGETLQLEATVAPTDATEKDVTWSVSFPADSKKLEDDPTDVATVSDEGLVTAVSAGEVVVTAKTKDGDFTASAEISVSNIEVTSIAISPDPVEVDVNETVELTATVSPENATVKTVTWSVAMSESAARTLAGEVTVEDYLEIDDEGNLTALQRCDECEFTVTATAKDSDVSESVDVTINYIPVTSITLDPNSYFTVGEGGTYQMEYTILPENASDQTVTWDVDFASFACRLAVVEPSIDEYATIDENGLITGVDVSTRSTCGLVVSASVADLEEAAEVDFNVLKFVTDISILNSSGGEITDQIEFSICPTGSYDFDVDTDPEDATDDSVTWSISSETGFSINSSGLLSYDGSQGSGQYTIQVTATADDGSGVTATITAIVNVAEAC